MSNGRNQSTQASSTAQSQGEAQKANKGFNLRKEAMKIDIT